MCRFFKLKWTVSFEEHVVHALDVRDVVEDKVPQKLKLVLNVVLELERVRNVPLRHDEEVIVADRSFWHGNIKMFRFTPNDQVTVNAFVFEAEPAVLILL